MDMGLTIHSLGDRNEYEVYWSVAKSMRGDRGKQARDEVWGRYHASREWAILRQRCRTRAGDICERCKEQPGQQLHHLTYLRRFREWLDDLLWVCDDCHDFLHARSLPDPRALPECGNQLDLWRKAA